MLVTTQQKYMSWLCKLHLAVVKVGVSSMWSLNAFSSVSTLRNTATSTQNFQENQTFQVVTIQWKDRGKQEYCVARFADRNLQVTHDMFI